MKSQDSFQIILLSQFVEQTLSGTHHSRHGDRMTPMPLGHRKPKARMPCVLFHSRTCGLCRGDLTLCPTALVSSVPGSWAPDLVQHPGTFTGDSHLPPLSTIHWSEQAVSQCSLTGVCAHSTYHGHDQSSHIREGPRQRGEKQEES